VLTADACGLAGGTYKGDDTICDPNPCDQPPPPPAQGACCFVDGSCQVLTAEACSLAGGTYTGDDSVCDPNPCDQPPPPPAEGACCFVDGSCQVLTAEACSLAGGTYTGDDTVCDPNPCDQPPPPPAEGACCFVDGSCQVLTAEACSLAGGTYTGDDTVCDPNPCEPAGWTGCGLGYWKNHQAAWTSTAYTPGDLVGSVFTIPSELEDLADDTLMNALKYPGGNGVDGAARLLLRTAVVALLNASHQDLNFPLSETEVIDAVNGALASLDRRTMMDVRHDLDMHNTQGCPLN
jgi:hypothetical protein